MDERRVPQLSDPAFHIFPYYAVHDVEDENIEQLSYEERLARLGLPSLWGGKGWKGDDRTYLEVHS